MKFRFLWTLATLLSQFFSATRGEQIGLMDAIRDAWANSNGGSANDSKWRRTA